ncbi:hypothetical protein [Pontibacter sp. BAB1700]|nr:hypothetical protein [Pontibacter sp. BAB1700]
MGGLAVITAVGFYFVVQYMERERLRKQPVVASGEAGVMVG